MEKVYFYTCRMKVHSLSRSEVGQMVHSMVVGSVTVNGNEVEVRGIQVNNEYYKLMFEGYRGTVFSGLFRIDSEPYGFYEFRPSVVKYLEEHK